MILWAIIPLLSQCLAYNVYWYDKTQTLANRQAMVHLFEWKWTDVANECENFLQHYGYGAVQISPPMEHIWANNNNDLPWWVRYQPVSYTLTSRSGDESQFKDMVNRCNKVGVRIIVDVVLNHMVGIGQKSGTGGISSSGSSSFDGTHGVETFPGVPYSKTDFNDFRCDGDIQGSDYQNSAEHVKNCRLVGLLDLNQGSTYVQQQIVAYLNKLVDYGVAGFRCDASKHMWPEDMETFLNSVKNLREDIFGSNQRPFVVHEVIDRGGEAVKCGDYVTIGRYTNFNFGAAVSSAAKGQNDWKNLANLGPGYGYGNNEDHDVLNFIDNHDNQRDDPPYVVTYKDGYRYQLAVGFMLAWPYGYPRVMSSFYFTQHDHGPPNSGASNRFATTSPTFNSDDTCAQSSGWVCEHRWVSTREMVKFRSAVQGTAAVEVVTENQRIAFAREMTGFFALNAQSSPWGKYFLTTLPAGNYCNHFNGGLSGTSCAGEAISVGADGSAYIKVNPNSFVGISMNSRIGGVVPPPVPPKSYSTTVILLKKDTQPGQNVFIRGGASHSNKCLSGPFQQASDPCSIPMFHTTTVPFVYDEYLTWSQQDNYLDFEGAEFTQGTHDGQSAYGTPLAYSTNDKDAVEYQPYNKYGPGYWMVQLKMDCTKSENGWFELKGYETPSGWEGDVSQKTCTGAVGGQAPFSSINHIAKCGAVNVFTWGSGDCIIDNKTNLKEMHAVCIPVVALGLVFSAVAEDSIVITTVEITKENQLSLRCAKDYVLKVNEKNTTSTCLTSTGNNTVNNVYYIMEDPDLIPVSEKCHHHLLPLVVLNVTTTTAKPPKKSTVIPTGSTHPTTTRKSTTTPRPLPADVLFTVTYVLQRIENQNTTIQKNNTAAVVVAVLEGLILLGILLFAAYKVLVKRKKISDIGMDTFN
ncbi:unnamed protein product [Caenorhabditis auriculariae]|uniref:alpha-amylase n=1 Tax=Caenorhabditis auriculariae TaxID=2777116 RepID=A0A8S1HH20_9PELO|nr:unnamed protein product [Caenorhabditis auriculariae]